MASAEEAIKVFISYSRTDSKFVDRLEASLRARGFGTWVDRRRIEGGQDWLDTIEHAIDGCQRMVLVLSPAAMESEYVRMEYRHALRISKPLIPALLLPCPTVPMDLPRLQWVDFQHDYEDGIKHLLIALTRETPLSDDAMAPIASTDNGASDTLVDAPTNPVVRPPDTPLRELYTSGLAARARDDLERTAIYWDQILERDPTYLNGTVAEEMEAIRPRLTPIRLQRLRETTETAHAHGEWAQEIAAWQGVLALEPKDAGAQTQLAIAQENSTNAEQYDIARELVTKGDQEAARYQLKLLWSRAKYYGDPAALAPGLGMIAPPSYRDAQKQKLQQAQADEQAAKLADRKSRRSRFRHGSLNLSLGVILLCVFGSITGVELGAGGLASVFSRDFNSTFFAAEGVSLLFALVTYVLGARRAVHPAIFALIALLAVGIAGAALPFLWPPQSQSRATTAQDNQRAVYVLPFFYYSDPLTDQRYHSHTDNSTLVYTDENSPPANNQIGSIKHYLWMDDEHLINKGSNYLYCGIYTLNFVPSSVNCIANPDPDNPNSKWWYCYTSQTCHAVILGTTLDLFNRVIKEGSLPGFALPLALLWALLGILMTIFRHGIRGFWRMRLRIGLSRLARGALIGLIAGFVLGSAIYFLGWPIAGFLCAALFAFLALVARFEWPSGTQIARILVSAGILLVASLLLWGLLLHIVAFLLLPMAIASVLGILWALSIVGTVRMWVIRTA